jgi:hypothetical protein
MWASSSSSSAMSLVSSMTRQSQSLSMIRRCYVDCRSTAVILSAATAPPATTTTTASSNQRQQRRCLSTNSSNTTTSHHENGFVADRWGAMMTPYEVQMKQKLLSYPVVPKSDHGEYVEYSVIHTDRSLNLMSTPFQQVMRDLNQLLKTTYSADKVAIIPGYVCGTL